MRHTPYDKQFQSTPSSRRETNPERRGQADCAYFNPLPPRGGRPCPSPAASPLVDISIHSLLAEGDEYEIANDEQWIPTFQSTPSSRRETLPSSPLDGSASISIHSLLAEGDFFAEMAKAWLNISIHSLLAEGDALQLGQLSEREAISIHSLLAEGDARTGG